MEVKYPNIEVNLIGRDSNALAIVGEVKQALRRAGVSSEEVDLYLEQAMAGDYDHLLQVTMAWVTIT